MIWLRHAFVASDNRGPPYMLRHLILIQKLHFLTHILAHNTFLLYPTNMNVIVIKKMTNISAQFVLFPVVFYARMYERLHWLHSVTVDWPLWGTAGRVSIDPMEAPSVLPFFDITNSSYIK